MPAVPTIRTERLRLRPFQTADAEAVHHLAGAKEVAAGTFPRTRWINKRLTTGSRNVRRTRRQERA